MGKYHCTVDLLFESCMTTDNFCFYLLIRLIQTSQTGGQWYSDTSPFSTEQRGQNFKSCLCLVRFILVELNLFDKHFFIRGHGSLFIQFVLTKRLSTKCLPTKCLSTKYMSTKCLSSKYMST
jgi:hypothetical protein